MEYAYPRQPVRTTKLETLGLPANPLLQAVVSMLEHGRAD